MTSNKNETSAFIYEQKGTMWKNVEVNLSPEFCRKPFPDDPQDSRIELLWTQKRTNNPSVRLFNGMKFRLADSKSVVATSTLTLSLGLSDYKSHVGTNVRPASAEQSQEEQSQEHPFLAHILGVEACVLTSDNYAVLFRRSQHVSDFAGFYCCPGGHAEPFRFFRRYFDSIKKEKVKEDNCSMMVANDGDGDDGGDNVVGGDAFDEGTKSLLTSSSKIDEAIPANDLRILFEKVLTTISASSSSASSSTNNQSIIEKLVIDELRHSIIEEVGDELGVPLGLIKVEGILGLVRAVSRTQRGKPDLVFRCRLNGISFEELKTKYFPHRNGDDAFEADDGSLLGIDLGNRIKNEQDKKEVIEWMWENHKMTPPSGAAIELAVEAWS